MRDGDFAIYKGKEFEFYMNMDNTIEIVSSDSDDLRLGFIARFDQYVKTINVNEVESIYSIRTIGIYKGHDVAIMGEENNKYLIQSGGNQNIFEALGFEIVERGVYIKWVIKSELENVREEKTLLYLDN